MAKDFRINGTKIDRITAGDWDRQPLASTLRGETVFNRLYRHTWKTNVATVSEFKLLDDLEGSTVTLTTTDHNDRNGDFKTYYKVIFRSLRANQISINMHQIQAEFLINV